MRCLSHLGAVAVLLLIGTPSAYSQQVATQPEKSLRQLFLEAEQLSKDPDKQEQAARMYQEVIRRHSYNESVVSDSLKELAKYYEDSDQLEKGIRFFALGRVRASTRSQEKVFKDIMEAYYLKHPKLVLKFSRELNQASRTSLHNFPASNELAKSILQRKDKTLREKSLKQLRGLFAPGSDDATKRAGLMTLQQVLTAKFDHKSFGPLVVPLLDSEDELLRAMALSCLPKVSGNIDDLPKIVVMTEDESKRVRQKVGSALIYIAKGKDAEVVIPALMKLMQDEEHDVIRSTIRSMWGQYTSPEFDEFLVGLSNETKYHHIVIYHCLSTISKKSPVVCQRLVEELSDPDWNNSGRAAWGLTYGVTEEAKPLVEAGLLKAIPEETNSYTRKQEFRALQQVATEKSRDYLQSVVDSDLETDQFKQLAAGVLSQLDQE